MATNGAVATFVLVCLCDSQKLGGQAFDVNFITRIGGNEVGVLQIHRVLETQAVIIRLERREAVDSWLRNCRLS